MSQEAALAERPTHPDRRAAVAGTASARVRAYRLLLVRSFWLAASALAIGIFVATFPVRWAQLTTPCPPGAGCAPWQLSPDDWRALADLGLSPRGYAVYVLGLVAAGAATFATIGALIFWRRSDELPALFVSLTLVVYGTQSNTDALLAARPAWAFAIRGLGILAWSCLWLFLFTFPDGRFVPGWTRVPAAIAVAVEALQALPGDWPLAPSRWPVPLGATLTLGILGIALFALVYRYRRDSTPVQRQQTKWLVFGFGVALALGIALAALSVASPAETHAGPAWTLLDATSSVVLFLPIPLAVGSATLRYRLWDIDPLINRTLVYGALTASVVAIYVLAVGYLGAVFQARGNLLVSLAAAGLVAVLFQPLRERLQRAVNRLLYGERDEPYAVLSRLARRLEGTLAPGAALETIVETVAEALKLPYAAIALRGDEDLAVVAEHGAPTGAPLVLPLAYQGETVGELRLAPRAPDEGFGTADRRLLDDLARQAGIAAHAVRLTADLQRSRERLVGAREEERRRLRRDLHDGLGPLLGSLTLKLGTARKLMYQDLAAADALLSGLKTDTQAAIGDIRRLVYALRPPALDELGLASALREVAAQYEHAGQDHQPLRVAVEAPDQLPPLPAAVEVAAYRIAQEALTNVVRHAGARRCLVRLWLDGPAGFLCLEVRDDGRGLPLGYRAGVGLGSMWERAAELGGTCLVEPDPGEGTLVSARLTPDAWERSAPMEPIRVLIADDHPFFRDGLRVLLEMTADTAVAGEATAGDEVIALAERLQPDVILMDLKMPGPNGIEATRRILAASPHIAVLVVTMYEDDDSVFAAMRAGARGYLLKGADEDEMLRAIRGVARGEAIFGPAVARRLLRFFAAPQLNAPPPAFPELTEREREILDLLAQGRANPEIAERLYLSPKTVRNHVSNIFGKLQVADRAQAIVRAREAGLGQEKP